jgi:hypothetical protein
MDSGGHGRAVRVPGPVVASSRTPCSQRGFGQAGAETVLDLLKNELQIVMRQAGTFTIGDVDGSRVGEA